MIDPNEINKLKQKNSALESDIKILKEELRKKTIDTSMLRNISDNSPDLVWAKDLEGKYLFANKATCKKLLNAKNTREPIGKDDLFFAMRERNSHPNNKEYHTFGEICKDSDKIILETMSPQRFKEFGNVKGKLLYLDVFKAPLFDSKGKLIGTVGSGRDVTQEQKKNEKIRMSEENYRNIFNVSNDAIIIYSKKTGSIIDVNIAAEKMYGFSRKELIKMKLGSLSLGKTPYNMKNASELKEKAIKSEIQNFRWIAKRKDGSTFWIEVELKTVIFNGEETIISIERDIDDKVKAELLLKESEERYKTLVENIRDGVIVHSSNKIVYVNPASIDIIGQGEPEEFFLGRNIDEFIHPDSMKDIKKRVKLIYEKKINVGLIEEKFIRTDGKTILTEVMASRIDYDGKPASLVVFRDISDKKITEQRLKESEASYRELFNSAIDSIYIQDENGVFLDVNEGAVKMYGYPKEFFIGKTPEILSAPGMNDFKIVKKCLAKALKGEPQQFEFWGKRKNGEIFPKIVRVSKGKFFGKNVIFAFSLDISESKKAEEERRIIEAQIRHTQKLESLGILAGGIAHDFNNLLTGILGNAGLARMDIPAGNPVLKSIKNIETTAVRAADLCNQLLAYSGKGRFVILPIAINVTIKEMTKLLETSLSKKIKINFEFSKESPIIEVDVSQFRQIIMNMILNASDSIGDKQGKITIKTGVLKKIERKSGLNLFLTENIKPCKFAYIEISDDGDGMEPEVIERIFDPFFTTKSNGRGLGLSAVIGIVKGHKGIISINSKLSKGTEFRIYFPASSKLPIHETTEDSKIEKWKSKGLILVADDESSIIELCETILSKYGFNVISAKDGKDAIKKFRKNYEKIVLVLLDMTMPGKNGIEVMEEISNIKPDVKAILSSGYNKDDAVKNFSESGFKDFLEKPYSPEKLIKIVKKVLSKPGGEKF